MKMFLKRTVMFALCLHFVVDLTWATLASPQRVSPRPTLELFNQEAVVPYLIAAPHRLITALSNTPIRRASLLLGLVRAFVFSSTVVRFQGSNSGMALSSLWPVTWNLQDIVITTVLVAGVLMSDGVGPAIAYIVDVTAMNGMPKRELAVLKPFLAGLEREQAVPGTGHVPSVVTISDQHGSIKKFDALVLDAMKQVLPPNTFPEALQLDPNKPLEPQLNVYGVSLRTSFTGKLFFHNLGDFMDRGADGVKIFRRSAELLRSGMSDFVIGNHDFWEFMNLQRFHLPWYEGFNFYGYRDAYGSVRENWLRKRHSQTEAQTAEWWEVRLAEYRADRDKRQKERWAHLDIEVNGKLIPGTKDREPGTALFSKVVANLTHDERELWDKFRGNAFKTEVYSGVRSVELMSVTWWTDLRHQFEQAYNAAETDPDSPAAKAWIRALDIMDGIIPVLRHDYVEGMNRGEWWLQVFEAINYQNYSSAEWWAQDWVFHKEWGESVLKELNKMRAAGKPEITTSNYLENKTLIEISSFFRDHFSLYRKDIYQNVYMHSFPPMNENAEFFFTYKGQLYRGRGGDGARSVWEGFDRITKDIRNHRNKLSDLYEAFSLVNSWYADNTTKAKVPNVAQWINLHGMDKIAQANGIGGISFTGHLPFHEFHTKLSEEDRGVIIGFLTDNRNVFVDHGMGDRFGDRGGYVAVSPDSVRLRGYASKQSTEIVWDPPTADGDKILFKNKGLSREEYLPTLIESVKRRIAELESGRPSIKGRIRLGAFPKTSKALRKAA